MLDVLMIGVGQCGGRILDQINKQTFGRSSKIGKYISRQNWPSNVETIAINTAINDLKELKYTKAKDRIHIPHLHGVGGNRKKGKKIFRENEKEITEAIKKRGNFDLGFVFTSAGGGTGSSFTPLLVDKLKYFYDMPIYAFVVLPFRQEGTIYLQNTAFTLREIRESSTDSIILIDNEYLGASGDDLKSAYDSINLEIAKRVLFLMKALDNEMVMVTDLGDLETTLRGGDKIATMGFTQSSKQASIDNVLKRCFSRSSLLFPTDVYKEAARAMIVIQGEKESMNLTKIRRELDNLLGQIGQIFKGVIIKKGSTQLFSLFSLTHSQELDLLYEKAVEAIKKEKGRKKGKGKIYTQLNGLEPEY